MTKSDQKVFLILCLSLAFIPIFIGNPYYLSIFIFIGIHSIITVGLNLLLGYAGQLSLGHAAFYGIGAYTSAIITGSHGFPVWLGFLLSVGLTIAVALIIGIPSLKLKGNYLAVVTLAFGIIVFILFKELTSITGGPSGLTGIPGVSIFGFEIDSELTFYIMVWTILIIILLATLNIIHSRIGRALRSIHDSELAANSIGINTSKCKIQVFVLSAVYAAIAGSLYAHYVKFVNPDPFSLFFSILLVMMVAIGGIRNVWGSLIGAAFFTVLPEILRSISHVQTLIYGLILLFVILFMPNGLVKGIPAIFRKIKNARLFT